MSSSSFMVSLRALCEEASIDSDGTEHELLGALLKEAVDNDDDTDGVQVSRILECDQTSDFSIPDLEAILGHCLLRSAELGSLRAATSILQHAAEPGHLLRRRYGSSSPLFCAVASNHTLVFNLYARELEDHLDLEERDHEGRTMIMVAALNENTVILDRLIKYGANVNATIHGRGNVLHLLAQARDHAIDTDIIRLLLVNKVSLKHQGDRRWTPLHCCCSTGLAEMAKEMLASHEYIDIDARDIDQRTPLHLSAKAGDETTVRILLKYGANTNASARFRWTALHLACKHGHLAVVKLLTLRGADCKARLDNGQSPLHMAAKRGHEDVVRYLCTLESIERDAQDEHGHTSLMLAAREQHYNIAEFLRKFDNPPDPSDPRRLVMDKFSATIIDFDRPERRYKGDSLFPEKKVTIADLLYNIPSHEWTVRPRDPDTLFRWIHLPVNQTNWVEELVTRYFVEERAGYVHGFEEIRDALRNQHCGPKYHSRFVRPTCLQTRSTHIPPGVSHDRNDSMSARHHTHGNTIIFCPFIHCEQKGARDAMHKTIQATLKGGTDDSARSDTDAALSSNNKLLCQAYIPEGCHGLHVRRTLDQSYYVNSTTAVQDNDQVVVRYQLGAQKPSSKSSQRSDSNFKMIMIDQLWMLVLGTEVLITAFPNLWDLPETDSLNTFTTICNDIRHHRAASKIDNVYDLALTITEKCAGIFSRLPDQHLQFLDMFKSSIDDASIEAIARDKTFRQNAAAVPEGHEQSAVEGLLDLSKEIFILANQRDARDEIAMLRRVLEEQSRVYTDFGTILLGVRHLNLADTAHAKIKGQRAMVDSQIKALQEMDTQAKRDCRLLLHLLDMKQKQANAFEAKSSAIQGRTVLIFTIATIIFLPMTFVASFFAMPISSFPRPGSDRRDIELSIGYVNRHVFGIGATASLVFICLGISLGSIIRLWSRVSRELPWASKKTTETRDLDATRQHSVVTATTTSAKAEGTIRRVSGRVIWQNLGHTLRRNRRKVQEDEDVYELRSFA